MPVNIQKTTGTATTYRTKVYAERVLKTLHRWRDNGCIPMVLPSASTGMEPNSMRVAWYSAREYVRENSAEFEEDDRKLFECISLHVQPTNPRGMLITRDKSRRDFADDLVAIKRGTDMDTDQYQRLMEFISAEHKELDLFEIAGPFTTVELEKYKRVLDQLRGVFLSELTPMKIRVIYYPSGAITT